MLNEFRFFDPDKATRDIAYELYNEVKDAPIISPHGHVDPKIFADNIPFPNPAELFIAPDHYVYRMLYSQGVKLEDLDIPMRGGKTLGKDPRNVWQIFADNYFLFRGTPSGVWLDYEFEKVFGLDQKLNSDNAQHFYDVISEKLSSPDFLPRNLFRKLNIEVLATTDAATDTLEHHKKINSLDWDGRVVPSFRPDGVTNFADQNWKANIDKLSEAVSFDVNNYKSYIKALENRREFFKQHGATATDHGVTTPYTHKLSDTEAEALFQKALKGEATEEDAAVFTANMLMEMARMSCEDGLTMMLHAGANRNHNDFIFNTYGLDKGCDIPQTTEYTNNMRELLNTYGNNTDFSLIVFTLDETVYARELAPMAGHYPAMKLGPAWWFHDSIEGMARFRHQVTETAGFYNTVGFIDDTRAFLSIPARHDVARRVDANFLAGQVTKHIMSKEEAREIIKDLTTNLAKKAYKL